MADDAGSSSGVEEFEPKAEAESDKEETAADEPSNPKWAAIRHREAQLTKSKEEFAQQREALKAEREAHAEQLKELAEWNKVKSRSKYDIESAAKLLGFKDTRELLERVAERGDKMTPEEARLHELEQQLETVKKEREEYTRVEQQRAEQAKVEANTRQWHESIEQFIKDSPDYRDSLVGVKDVAPAVFQVMQEHYAETNEQMPYEDAVKQVSTQLESRVTSMLDEIVSNKRGLEIFNQLASKLNRPAPASQKAQKGITQRISNSTGAKRTKPLRFDETLDDTVNWLNSQ